MNFPNRSESVITLPPPNRTLQFALASTVAVLLVADALILRSIALSDQSSIGIVLVAGILFGMLIVVAAGWAVHRDNFGRARAETALQDSERRYRMLVEGVKDCAMLMLGPQGEIQSWGPTAERITGYSSEEMKGENFSRLFTAEDIKRNRPAEILRIAATSREYEEQGARIRKDGTRYLVRASYSAWRDPDGNLRGFSVISRDLTESDESGVKYRGLMEAAPDAMVVVNQAGEIVLLNLQAEKKFGYRRDELVGQKVTNIIPEGFAERLIADDLRSSEDALAQQIGTGIELNARRKDGSEFPIEIMLSPLESADGVLVTAAIRDISVRRAAEKHLGQMEGRYRGLMEAAPDAMVVVNQAGEIVLLNLQAEKKFGYRRDELVGQKVTNIIPEGFAERLIADDLRSSEDALAQQIGTGIELNARRKDGSEFPIEIMLSPLESTDGVLVTAAIRDISVRRAAEKHLGQMEGRYRGLLEAAPDAMVVVNQAGEIVLLNVQAEKQFGYRRDELLGQQVTNIIPEGFAERLIADDLRSDEDALAQKIGTGIELNARRKDGSEFPIEIMLSPLESAEGMLVTAAIRDISVRRAAEKHLGQMEGRYRGLLEAAPDAMVVVNQAGEIVLLNVQAEKQFGYRRDELLGQKVTNIIPDGFAARLAADALRSDEDALAQQIGTGIELTGRRKDGGEFPLEIMLSPLESAEGTLVTAAIRNISVRKHMERLKDEFVATVSHELRTPLTSIAGSLGLLVGLWAGKLPEPAARLMRIAHSNSQRLVRLINDILDIEKIEFGRVAFRLRRVDARTLVEQAIEGNRGFAEGYDVRVRLDAGSSGGSEVNADPDRLAQVVTNLLSNAIKFSPAEGEVVVKVENTGGAVRISVRDHGPGIPAEFKPRIFEKFAQADATNTRQEGGTGLGLSIAKQIVQRLDGELRFDDAPGGGTIFYVDLPNWDSAANWETDIDAQAGASRILLCENDRDTAVELRERLRQFGFAVDFAYTAGAAVERAAVTDYTTFLVDLHLPDDDGINLIVRLRDLEQHRETPMVVISGAPDEGRDDVRSSQLNVLGWLCKPVDLTQLLGIVRSSVLVKRPRVLHVDDDHVTLATVTDALRTTADVVSADSLLGARTALAAAPIDLAVLNTSVGAESGLDLLPSLRGPSGAAIPVIVLSDDVAGLAGHEQIHATLLKSDTSPESLIATVRDHLPLVPDRPDGDASPAIVPSDDVAGLTGHEQILAALVKPEPSPGSSIATIPDHLPLAPDDIPVEVV